MSGNVEVVHVGSVSLLGCGDPVPQGSKRIGRAGKSRRPLLIDANAKTKPWRDELARAALEHFGTPELGDIRLTCTFYFTRPQSHYHKKFGGYTDLLKSSAPSFKKSKPDLDKLLRSVFDALTGIAWRDDSQVVSVDAYKRWGVRGSVVLSVWRMEVGQ